MYYRGAIAAIVMFDVTNGDSWDNLKRWVQGSAMCCSLSRLCRVEDTGRAEDQYAVLHGMYGFANTNRSHCYCM